MSIIELDIQGMTCASCAARSEKKRNRDGVQLRVRGHEQPAAANAQAAVTGPL